MDIDLHRPILTCSDLPEINLYIYTYTYDLHTGYRDLHSPTETYTPTSTHTDLHSPG